jgi:Zn-dependent protease
LQADIARLLLRANLILGIFNLYPAFPMDGGRVLRALLAMRLPYLRATFWAVMVGRVLAVVGIAASVYFQNYVLTAAFIFIMMASTNEYRAVQRREILDAQWKEAVRRHLENPAAATPPVLDI